MQVFLNLTKTQSFDIIVSYLGKNSTSLLKELGYKLCYKNFLYEDGLIKEAAWIDHIRFFTFSPFWEQPADAFDGTLYTNFSTAKNIFSFQFGICYESVEHFNETAGVVYVNDSSILFTSDIF